MSLRTRRGAALNYCSEMLEVEMEVEMEVETCCRMPSVRYAFPCGWRTNVLFRFLKAKLAACQDQLDEALSAHKASQADAAELRKQVQQHSMHRAPLL